MAAARLPDELARVARELYGLPPEAFTAARTDAVKQARAAGDRELAKAVGGLRRPAVAAWAVNLLVREREGLLDQVTSMGDSLREAQAQLDGEALRELTRQRRRLVTAVTAEVGAVAASHHHPLSAAASRQVEETVQAALVDPQAAAAVRSGLLVSSLTATGVGAADVVDSVAIPAAIGLTARPRPMPAPKRAELSVVPDLQETPNEVAAAKEAERKQAQQAVEKARDDADDARRRVRKAAKRVEKVQARTLQAAEELEEARRRVVELEHELETLDEDAVEADERKERADQRYVDAQEALEEAQTALDRL